MFEDHGSTRIDLACPHCQQQFKVRLRKLQFGADLTCRLCRHEFSAREVSSRPDVQSALARMQTIVRPRTQNRKPRQPSGVAASLQAKQPNRLQHKGEELRPLIPQRRGEQGSSDI
ncbi:transcription elongation factor Elf1 [Microvirga lupini]|uniref:Transcription elongation factor Elf1 n=1 Tax=Microvirga lupini TaxID=420324 RepID=A0A7W4VP95_9HYPH|nr:transcription elongation factor Elf1 [Microvirga lupini]